MVTFRGFRLTEIDGIALEVGQIFYVERWMNVQITDGSILDMYWNCIFSVEIVNVGDAIGTQNIIITGSWDQEPEHRKWSESITLKPSQSYLWQASQWIDFRRASYYKFTLQGDWLQNNYSEGLAKL